METIYDDFIYNSKLSLENEISQRLFAELTTKKNNGFDALDIIFKSLKNDTYMLSFVKKIFVLLAVFVVVGILFKSLFYSKANNIIVYAASVIFSFIITASVYEIVLQACKYIKELSSFFGVCSSAMVTLCAYGGNISTASTQSAFLSVFLIIFQVLINKLVPFCIAFFAAIAIIDALWGQKKFISFSNIIKNFFYTAFALVTGIVFIIINSNFKISASADAMSGKTLKLLLGKAIPIVGGSVGDALNVLGGSVSVIKNSVGTVATVVIIALSISPFLLLFATSFMLNFFSFIGDYFGIAELKNIFIHVKCSVDFTIAALFMVVVIMFINITLFINVIPSVTS